MRSGPGACRSSSALLAYDAVRILIWLDHMGLRVATLVNLSFLGMDKLEQRLARFLAPAATARCIPEGVKRFTTWAPLLIPFYIPRGQGLGLRLEPGRGDPKPRAGRARCRRSSHCRSPSKLLLAGRRRRREHGRLRGRSAGLRARSGSRRLSDLVAGQHRLRGRRSGRTARSSSQRPGPRLRRQPAILRPARPGRPDALPGRYRGEPGRPPRAWPVVGNFPGELADALAIRAGRAMRLTIVNTSRRASRRPSRSRLPGADDPVELWTITVENLSDAARRLKVVPYLEWVLNRPEADRGHTQYNRLFAEMEYVARAPRRPRLGQAREGHGLPRRRTSRPDGLPDLADRFHRPGPEPLDAAGARDTGVLGGRETPPPHPTFDPIGSLLLGMTLPATGLVPGPPPDRPGRRQGARRST